MFFHERNLPHCYPPGATLFLTWRLFGALPQALPENCSLTPGRAFAEADRRLDADKRGPQWLKDPRIATIVIEALHRGSDQYRLYDLSAWAIMPNHIHSDFKPLKPLPAIMRWLKGSTARSANPVLGRTGKPFWQYETYDHCVRTGDELNRIIRYVANHRGLSMVQRRRRPKAYSTPGVIQ
jgi:REP element-mobilizing transposase RayT